MPLSLASLIWFRVGKIGRLLLQDERKSWETISIKRRMGQIKTVAQACPFCSLTSLYREGPEQIEPSMTSIGLSRYGKIRTFEYITHRGCVKLQQ